MPAWHCIQRIRCEHGGQKDNTSGCSKFLGVHRLTLTLGHVGRLPFAEEERSAECVVVIKGDDASCQLFALDAGPDLFPSISSSRPSTVMLSVRARALKYLAVWCIAADGPWWQGRWLNMGCVQIFGDSTSFSQTVQTGYRSLNLKAKCGKSRVSPCVCLPHTSRHLHCVSHQFSWLKIDGVINSWFMSRQALNLSRISPLPSRPPHTLILMPPLISVIYIYIYIKSAIFPHFSILFVVVWWWHHDLWESELNYMHTVN